MKMEHTQLSHEIERIHREQHFKICGKHRDRLHAMIEELGDNPPAAKVAELSFTCAASFTNELISNILSEIANEEERELIKKSYTKILSKM